MSWKTTFTTRDFLIQTGALKNKIDCPRCGAQLPRLKASAAHGHPDGRFNCPKCQRQYGGRTQSIYEGTRKPLKERIICTFLWYVNDLYRTQLREVHLSEHLICEVRLTMNAIAQLQTENDIRQIGGPLVVVEVDEVQIRRRKNGVGRLKEEIWVIGGVERPMIQSNDRPPMFLDILPSRSKESIEAALTKWIKKGTIVITDAYIGYADLERLGFVHFDVNHREAFIDPHSGAHTERIEGLWHQLRRSLPGVGVRAKDLPGYLAAEMFRRRVGSFRECMEAVGRSDPEEVKRILNVSPKPKKGKKEKPKQTPQSQESKMDSVSTQIEDESEEMEEEEEEQAPRRPQTRQIRSKAKPKKTAWQKRREASISNKMEANPEAVHLIKRTRYTSKRTASQEILTEPSETESEASPTETDNSTSD